MSDVKIQLAVYEIRRCAFQYQRTANPLYLWKAYRMARAAGIQVPEWILTYLDDVARDLGAIEPKGKELPKQIQKAMKLHKAGGGGSYWELRDRADKRLYAVRACVFQESRGLSPQEAADHIINDPGGPLDEELETRAVLCWKKDILSDS